MPISTTQQQASPLTPSAYVETTLKYSSFPEISPKEKYYIHIDDTDKKNFVNVDIPTKVYDLRGQEASTHIDTTGFQALTSPSDVSAELLLTGSDEEVAQVYYPEVEALLKEHTGASRVVFFDHTIRKPHPPEVPESPSTRRPVIQVHVDQTPASAHRRVERHVQPPQPYKRFQIINVWRPIQNTVYDYPLGVCEWNTLDVVNDLIPTTLVYAPPTPAGETYGVRYNENYRWWYWSEMTPNDVLFLKCYDSSSRALTTVKTSAADVLESELRDVAGLTPHTAFLDAEGAKKGIPRSSIEVRALVFYDD